jgi:MFS family permease
LALLLSINLFNYIDRFVLAALLKPIEKDLLPEGGPNNGKLLGALTMAFMLSYMIFAPVFGYLSDRTSRWKLIGLGVILWSLASGASGLPGSYAAHAPASLHAAGFLGASALFWFLLATRCFVGIGEAAYGPAAPAVISDLYPVEGRGKVLSWFYAAIPVGGALGYIWGGAVGWPDAFYWVVPPGLVLGALCFFMPEPARGQTDLADPAQARNVGLRDYRRFLRNPSYVLATLGYTAATFAVGGIAAWMPYYLEEFRGVPADQANFNFGIVTVVSGLTATLAGGWLGDRLRARFPGSYFLVSAAGMFVGFPLFLAVLYTPFPWVWVPIFLACFCLFFNTGPVNTILANVTHPSLRAAGFALNIFVIHALGDAISPFVIGSVADAFAERGRKNMNAGFLAVSGAVLVSALFWAAGTPFLARDTANAPRQLDDEPPTPA